MNTITLSHPADVIRDQIDLPVKAAINTITTDVHNPVVPAVLPVPTVKRTVWGSLECDAWSRGFDYANYVNLCKHSFVTSVSEPMYRALYNTFADELIRNMQATGFQA